jgi:hypothetical protein
MPWCRLAHTWALRRLERSLAELLGLPQHDSSTRDVAPAP